MYSQVSPHDEETFDVIVVGAGVGGLSCAGLTSRYGCRTLCLEAHDTPGGVAHSFKRFSRDASRDVPFRFDSGPSLITGLSKKSTNPLRQVLDALGTADEVDWKTYDGWVIWDYADGKALKLTTGDSGAFERAMEEKQGVQSRKAFEAFKEEILKDGGLAEVSAYIPPFALRNGNPVLALVAVFQYLFKILTIGTKGLLLTGPFTKTMDLYSLEDPWVRKFFDYLAFALSGVDASNTQGAPIAYMMSDLHRKGSVLDYPMGGMESLIKALVKGMEKHGGELRLNGRVERFLLEQDGTSVRCVGVELQDGTRIKAKKGVVSNAPLWNYARILRDSVNMQDENSLQTQVVKSIQEQADSMSMTRSFMHLHLGIPKDGLPDDMECHHSVLNFDLPVTDEQNMSIISIPTVFDPSLAPEGYHIVHAYTAASDSFDDWVPFQEETGKVGASPNSGTSQAYSRKEGYEDLKAQKAEALWKAVECVIPDVRERVKRKGAIALVGSPLTHRRYNQRYQGTYGPGVNPGKEVWELAGATTPIQGLYACGDTR
jgi:phytoene dehydrogenase-like protein